jgi:hypothetical protein
MNGDGAGRRDDVSAAQWVTGQLITFRDVDSRLKRSQNYLGQGELI